MKNYRLQLPEGVKDLLWESAVIKNQIEANSMKVFHRYNYHFIDTPTFEYLDVFSVDTYNTQNPHLYQFVNRQGELMALRSDMTMAIARVVATQNNSLPRPQRYCYLSKNFRYPKRFQGKSHEFTQGGIELIGSTSIYSDVEVIQLAIECLIESGIDAFTLHLGSASFFSYLLEELDLSEKATMQIYEAIDRKDGVLVKHILEEAKIKSDLIEVVCKLIQSTGSIELLRYVKESLSSQKIQDALSHLETLYDLLDRSGLSRYIQFDFSILSYATYYTGMMFQVYVAGLGETVIEGGRYDRLLAKYGKDLPAVGFGVNMDLLVQKIEKEIKQVPINEKVTLIVFRPEVHDLAMAVARQFRNQGLVVETCLEETLERAVLYAKEVGIGGILYFKSEDEVEIHHLMNGTVETVCPKTLL